MQLTKLQMVDEECARDLRDEGAELVETFYRHQKKWWRVTDKTEVTGSERMEFEKCIGDRAPYRTRKSQYANFPLGDVEAVVRAKFGVALRQSTLEANQRVVLRAFRNASNAFAVRYNPMTGLLGKSSFQALLAEQLVRLSDTVSPTAAELGEKASAPALCLLALDIDRFKQTNDSYGHVYGDLVIKSFALRLESAATAFCKGFSARMSVSCAHVSGEEFFCLAWGEVETPTFEALANKLLRTVSDAPLPSEEEFSRLGANFPMDSVAVPALQRRNVTCSIGGVVSGPLASKDPHAEAQRLITQADLALNTSKNQGRERVTFFSSILQVGGRVLEHKADVGICIVDIGADVGVVNGQEFMVFHPDFAGDKAYVIDDGRSRKTLGTLPKSLLCTIVVFEVQRQIAFCRFSEERHARLNIPRDSRLEAIPLGTLSVPFMGPLDAASSDASIERVASIGDTRKHINITVHPADLRSFTVVRIRNEAQVLSEFGPASINRGLASACETLRKLQGIEFIGQIELTQLLLQHRPWDTAGLNALEVALAQAEGTQRLRFVAGVFLADETTQSWPGTGELEARVDLARYAASQEGAVDNRQVEIFSEATATRIVTKLRMLREPQRALADYNRFVRIGIASAPLHNAAGLCWSALGESAKAEACYLQAAELEPSIAVFKLNALTMQFQQGNVDAAVRTALSIEANELDASYKFYPWPVANMAFAYSEHAIRSRDVSLVSAARLWLERALSLEIDDETRSALTARSRSLSELQLASPEKIAPTLG